MDKILKNETDFSELIFQWENTYSERVYKVKVNGRLLIDAEKNGACEFHKYRFYDSFQKMADSLTVPPGMLSEIADELGLE